MCVTYKVLTDMKLVGTSRSLGGSERSGRGCLGAGVKVHTQTHTQTYGHLVVAPKLCVSSAGAFVNVPLYCNEWSVLGWLCACVRVNVSGEMHLHVLAIYK